MTTGGTFSYRIKQILDTSTANFTAIYIDTVNTSCNTVTLKIVPNPVTTNQVTLKIESDFAVQKLNILFIDMLGQTVLQSSSSKTEGTTSFNFPIQHLPEGIYIVVIYDGQKRLVSKQFIKL